MEVSFTAEAEGSDGYRRGRRISWVVTTASFVEYL